MDYKLGKKSRLNSLIYEPDFPRMSISDSRRPDEMYLPNFSTGCVTRCSSFYRQGVLNMKEISN